VATETATVTGIDKNQLKKAMLTATATVAAAAMAVMVAGTSLRHCKS